MADASSFRIRPARAGDLDSLSRIFRDSILHLGPERYTEAQVAVWASHADDTHAFRDWIEEAMTLVVTDGAQCIGFGGLQDHGRIASLFVTPGFMRKGVATMLVRELLSEAAARGLKSLTADASEFSRPVFENCGFVVSAVEHTEYKGVDFTRYSMKRNHLRDLLTTRKGTRI